MIAVAAACIAGALVASGFALLQLRSTRGEVVARSGELEGFVRSFVQQMPRPGSNGYDQPTPDEQARMADAFRAIQEGRLDEAAASVAPLRYEVVRFTDAVTGRELVMLSEVAGSDGSWTHGWGIFIFAPSSSSRLTRWYSSRTSSRPAIIRPKVTPSCPRAPPRRVRSLARWSAR